jgi:hypothetical protein
MTADELSVAAAWAAEQRLQIADLLAAMEATHD